MAEVRITNYVSKRMKKEDENMIFKQKSEQEKQIKNAEHELLKLKRKRDFLQPRVKTTFFFKNEVEEVVPTTRYEEVQKLTSKIIELEDRLLVLKKDQ